MQTTNTSVLARRIWIDDDYATLAYEAGWASEAVFFTQVEGEHPELTVATEISPDGITWIERGGRSTLTIEESITENALTTFGTWVRVRIRGASSQHPARVLVHVNLKG
ncbi:DUF6385 domain-containing protein [Ruania zhangjianzhongii]|uniref:DUF6385 domain-containing protein n=1 Tax=Ruania zhangjianzhongii TaxID=2603206 RepID=UPI0011C8A4FC|nr:DUF6385 domain-containing protein [Ruania zhangjianzhongii]